MQAEAPTGVQYVNFIERGEKWRRKGGKTEEKWGEKRGENWREEKRGELERGGGKRGGGELERGGGKRCSFVTAWDYGSRHPL